MNPDDISEVSPVAALSELCRSLSAASSHAQATELCLAAVRQSHAPCCALVISTRSLSDGRFRICRWIDLAGADVVAQPADFDPSRLDHLPVRCGGVMARVVADPRPKSLRLLDLSRDAALDDRLATLRSLAAAPMYEAEEVDGWIVVLQPAAEPDDSALTDIAVLASVLAGAYSRLALADRLRRIDVELHREIDQISELQRAMLPAALPNVPGLELAAGYKTFDRAGGDYYDVFPLGGGSERRTAHAEEPWGILVADASGHGPAATVLVAMLSGVLHAYEGRPTSPAEFLEYLNRHLAARNFCGDFVTAVFAIFDPRARTLTWAHAGHSPPLLKDGRRGTVRVLDDPGGVPLGIQDRVDARDHLIRLEPGELMLLYTDGVVDERDDNDAPFGLDRLVDFVARDQSGPAGLVATLSRALDAHQGVTRPEDDQTMLALRLTA